MVFIFLNFLFSDLSIHLGFHIPMSIYFSELDKIFDLTLSQIFKHFFYYAQRYVQFLREWSNIRFRLVKWLLRMLLEYCKSGRTWSNWTHILKNLISMFWGPKNLIFKLNDWVFKNWAKKEIAFGKNYQIHQIYVIW